MFVERVSPATDIPHITEKEDSHPGMIYDAAMRGRLVFYLPVQSRQWSGRDSNREAPVCKSEAIGLKPASSA